MATRSEVPPAGGSEVKAAGALCERTHVISHMISFSTERARPQSDNEAGDDVTIPEIWRSKRIMYGKSTRASCGSKRRQGSHANKSSARRAHFRLTIWPSPDSCGEDGARGETLMSRVARSLQLLQMC
eukprot:scaffold130549_cov31-Tisochrysis_lutea.AAC.2